MDLFGLKNVENGPNFGQFEAKIRQKSPKIAQKHQKDKESSTLGSYRKLTGPRSVRKLLPGAYLGLQPPF